MSQHITVNDLYLTSEVKLRIPPPLELKLRSSRTNPESFMLLSLKARSLSLTAPLLEGNLRSRSLTMLPVLPEGKWIKISKGDLNKSICKMTTVHGVDFTYFSSLRLLTVCVLPITRLCTDLCRNNWSKQI